LGVLVIVALLAAVRPRAQTERRQSVVSSGTEIIFATRFSPDSRTLAISRGERDDNRVELWDTVSGSLKHSIKGFDGPVWSVSFAHDSQTLVTGSGGIHSEALQDSRKLLGKRFVELKWWDAQTGDLKKRLELPGDDRFSLLALHSPNGKLL